MIFTREKNDTSSQNRERLVRFLKQKTIRV